MYTSFLPYLRNSHSYFLFSFRTIVYFENKERA